jgi:hypothetical protein
MAKTAAASPTAKPKRVRRPRKSAPEATQPSPEIALPVLSPAPLEVASKPQRKVARVQSSDTAVLAESPTVPAIAPNNADRSSPPWPLWDQAATVKSPKVSWLARLRAKQLSPTAVTIAIAASFGAMTGSLATVGVAKFIPLDVGGPSVAVDEDLVQHIARVDAELVALKANLGAARVVATAEHADQRMAASSDTTGSILASSAAGAGAPPSVAAPLSAPVVEGWVLRNVYGGSALVEGRPGLIQVMPGDSLPGVGRVETIKREEGRWVVVTTRGLIVAR